jgi:alpha-ketoglutarate-dependent 2,4-dichlorophenoxyacetate dioxygenase
LVQTGPDGRKLLYLAAHAKRIMGMSESESQKLIWELIEHCAKPEYTFELEWQNAGDLVWYVKVLSWQIQC